MRKEHKSIQRWIKQKYQHRYQVGAEIDEQNRLPDRKRHWYQPDVILRDSKDNIRFIIEIENDPIRKALIGASILADYSVRFLKQRIKPRLIFVVYAKQGIRQIPNFKKKIQIARSYCAHLSNIEVYSWQKFQMLQL